MPKTAHLRALGSLLSALAVLGCQAACAGAGKPAESRPLRWAADAEGGAPYIFKDPDDPAKTVGFEVDLAGALARELGRAIEWVQYDYIRLLAGLDRRDFDFAMNGIEVTPDRAKAFRLSRPYYVYTEQLVVRAEEDRFTTLEDCLAMDAVVGTLDDTAAKRLLDQLGIRTRSYDNQTEPYLDLQNGNVDAVFLDLPIAMYYAAGNKKLKFVGQPLNPGYYAIVFRKDQEELATEVDKAIERLLESGELKRIYEKWRLWNEDQARLHSGGIQDVLRESSGKWTPAVYVPLLLQGAAVTVEISILSMALAVLFGLPLALARLYGPWPVRAAATVYVEFFRGIPVLLLLYFLYYGLPAISDRYDLWIDLRLAPMTAAIIGFGLNYAAYEAEIYRAGVRSVPAGQWEAAASLGMSRWLTFRRIVFPQAVRVILPPMTNDFVALFKDTSLVSIVAVVELTKQYQILSKSSLKYLEIGAATALLYLVMSVPLGYLSRRLEHRWGKGQ